MKKFKFLITSLLAIVLILSITGCKKKQQIIQQRPDPITLNYYRVFEPEEYLKPIIKKFEQANPHITVNYRNFTDLDTYLSTIISELAEGRGPDLISVPNTWVAQNYKKLSPAPSTYATPQIVNDAFVNIVSQDNVFVDTDGDLKVFGLPLGVDTLALYYNDKLFEQYLPEIGKPTALWSDLYQVTDRLTLPDTEEGLIRSGIALGSGEGILRSADVAQLMLMQNSVQFFDSNYRRFTFANSLNSVKAFEFINSFNKLPSSTPAWLDELGSAQEKEIYAFATGKTTMIFGYSYLYNEIENVIQLAKRQGGTTINLKDVKVTTAPQNDPQDPVYLANYYTETVTRNSKYPNESWKLITYLVDPKNLETYYKQSFKPSSRRELISTQRTHPIYSAFAEQLGSAHSVPLPDALLFSSTIQEVIDNIKNSTTQSATRAALIKAQDQLNNQISNEGAYPPSLNKLNK